MDNNLTIDKKEIKKLLHFADKCIRVRSVLRIGSTSLTPLNYDDERDKFFQSKIYNPVFFYRSFDLRKIDTVINHLDREIDKLDLPEDIKEKLKLYTENLRLIRMTKSSVGMDTFTDLSKRLLEWDKLRDTKVDTNLKVTIANNHQGKLYNAHEIRHKFLDVLDNKYKIRDFDVLIDEFTNNIISAGYKKVTIGSRVKRRESDVKRLIVHEIESHVIQTHNVKLSHAYADLSLYGESLLCSEGLAVYNEISTKSITENSFETYKQRYIISTMLNESFRTIFNYLCEFMTPERAYIATYRAKRGVKETGLPGGFVKDAIYLIGYFAVMDYVNKNKSQKNLYKTKSPNLTSLLEKYNLLSSKLILPTFIKND